MINSHVCRKRLRVEVQGRVQGVGFRPTVYRYARERNLTGCVSNTSAGVTVEVEGEEKDVDDFIESLSSSPPPQAEITRLVVFPLPLQDDMQFEILPSRPSPVAEAQVSPDVATCPECLRELFDPGDRRYLYPFLNCTSCGPRFTIIEDIPYDRDKTTMRKFAMCSECRSEYEDPLNRRFHAQPNACADCGPQVELVRISGTPKFLSKGAEAIRGAVGLLKRGEIVVIKGLGGFHLACDARNETAVRNLRAKKGRQKKPFALMAGDVKAVEKYCELSLSERDLLLSSKTPVVLLRKHKDCPVSADAAPDNKYLGFMLPYTPVHHLLFHELAEGEVLVMTSGNVSDEPIVYKDSEVFTKLGGIADYVLTHDRDIFTRCDDSVTRLSPTGREIVTRRARGYAPQPITVKGLESSKRPVLACGGHLKNTFALTRGSEVFISRHIGDLESFETLKTYESAIEHFKRLFKITPAVVACDLHPEYLSTRYAVEHAGGREPVRIQHHHAHIASCLADNGLGNQKVIGVAFDGTGFGNDGTLWGGEFLVSDYTGFKRAAHLKYMRLPGGEKAIRQPWRVAVSLLYEIYGAALPDLDFIKGIDSERCDAVRQMLDKEINCPYTSSMGRLFDGVSALLGLSKEITYEGEAAVLLEMAIEDGDDELSYEYEIQERADGLSVIDYTLIIKGVVEDLKTGISPSAISGRFHNTVAELILETCKRLGSRFQLNEAALSGGVFQNMFLLDRSYRRLTEGGFKVYVHHRVPPNDGGISLGQAVIAGFRG